MAATTGLPDFRQLARAKVAQGDLAGAAELLVRASGLAPGDGECLTALGELHRRLGRLPEALDALLRALSLQPSSLAVTVALGRLLVDMGELDAAAACQERASGRASSRPLADRLSVVGLVAFGKALHRQDRAAEAASFYRKAVARSPELVAAHNGLGIALLGMQRGDEALESFRRVTALDPDGPLGHYNVGTVLQKLGRVAEACEAFRRALALDPGYAGCRSSLVYSLAFHPADDPRPIVAEARAWNDAHAAPLARTAGHTNDRSPDRRLRIGYLSPDFGHHCQSFFTVPLFRHHDREAFEVLCYSWTPNPDATTARLAASADGWQDLRGLGDEEAARRIEQDRVDVLVDLTMHMARNRMGILARKPAPVQVCWLAYPGTTGLSAIDYRITDRFLDPVGGDDTVYSEASLRLPDTFWCYDPLAEPPPDVGPLPALERGYVTFGSLNSFTKVSEGVVALWARVLGAVPGSRLTVRVPDGSARASVLSVLGTHGIDGSRITTVPWVARREYLETYRGIDVGLDPFPYGGHTTSLDAFWMGVPVVTRVGRTVVSRAGLCIAMNLGLPELVTTTPDEYVRAAIDLCADLPRLASLRAGLRGRMQASPLMNAARFARNLESAYREAWRTWCTGSAR